MPNEWIKRAGFVNLVLAWGIGRDLVAVDDVEFDGVAGQNFDTVLAEIDGVEFVDERDDLIKMAIKLGVPVEGLTADGEFGPKWTEVVELCKRPALFSTKPSRGRNRPM